MSETIRRIVLPILLIVSNRFEIKDLFTIILTLWSFQGSCPHDAELFNDNTLCSHCQALFSTFPKFFQRLSEATLFIATAFIDYHLRSRLSSTFFDFFLYTSYTISRCGSMPFPVCRCRFLLPGIRMHAFRVFWQLFTCTVFHHMHVFFFKRNLFTCSLCRQMHAFTLWYISNTCTRSQRLHVFPSKRSRFTCIIPKSLHVFGFKSIPDTCITPKNLHVFTSKSIPNACTIVLHTFSMIRACTLCRTANIKHQTSDLFSIAIF